jgi:Ca2+-binding RTX toxin-like protein
VNEGSGNDYVLGNEGDNNLFSIHGFDHVNGEGGNDVISVVDGGADVVDCGAGYDTVLYDGPGRNSSGFLTRGDRVTNCEVLQPS